MTTNPWNHDSWDPMSHLNAIEAAWLASDKTVEWCHYCTPELHMLPMSGPGWGVEVFHEPWCPEHDDNQPTPEWPA